MNGKQASLLLVASLLVASALAVGMVGDGGAGGDGRVRVVATFYPLGYMAEHIGGNRVTVTTLMPPNQEVHVYHPTTSDRLEADRAQVIVYNGAGLDMWFEEDLLPELKGGGRVVVDTTEGLPLIGGGDGHDGAGVDPHTWISPHMAMLQGERVLEALVEADPAGEDAYRANWEVLRASLDGLDFDYARRLANATLPSIVVSHEAYGYLAHRYGFEQHGAIGISAEEQPSATALADLVALMEDGGIRTVFVDPVYSRDYADTLRDELEARTGWNVRVLPLYFMLGPIDGLDILGQMEANLDALAEGLGVGA